MPWGFGVEKDSGVCLSEGAHIILWVGGWCAHRKSHQECSGKTGGRGRPRQARRHKTCPSPREISKVMASMDMLNEGGCSEDELLEKCIQSFGECLPPWPAFAILRLGQASL